MLLKLCPATPLYALLPMRYSVVLRFVTVKLNETHSLNTLFFDDVQIIVQKAGEDVHKPMFIT